MHTRKLLLHKLSFYPFFYKPRLTPHIGAATVEAQERIGTELANQIINHFNTISV